jgi:Zn finger protein HypA/HybF involved in hydrogenase expression
MNRRKAKFAVVEIEVMVHCPHCDATAKSPLNGGGLIWNAAAVQHQGSKDAKCAGCRRWFRLSQELRDLLRPSSEPVRHDQRVNAGAAEIVCGNCAGLGAEPIKTLLARNGRCSTCGGDNYVVAPNQLNTTEFRNMGFGIRNERTER